MNGTTRKSELFLLHSNLQNGISFSDKRKTKSLQQESDKKLFGGSVQKIGEA